MTVNQAEFEGLKRDLVFAYWLRYNPVFIAMFRKEVPVDTGLLRSQHRSTTPFRQGRYWVIRWVAPTGYDIYVHQGTRPVVRAVSSVVKAGRKLGARVLARTSGGQRPNPWLVRSFQQLGLRDVRWLRPQR